MWFFMEKPISGCEQKRFTVSEMWSVVCLTDEYFHHIPPFYVLWSPKRAVNTGLTVHFISRQSCTQKPISPAVSCWKLSLMLSGYVWKHYAAHAFYTVHRCFGNSDALIISPVPMVTKMDVSLWKSWRLFASHRGRGVDSIGLCVSVFQRQANANTTCDVFEGFTDRRVKVDPLTFHSHTLFHGALPFDDSFLILLLSSWTVALYPTVLSGQVDITVHDGRGSGLILTLTLMSSWCGIKAETLVGAAEPLQSSTAPL